MTTTTTSTASAATSAPPADRQIDPRAVRVALAPTLAHVGLAAMVLEPLPIPVAPIPSVAGVGILGGTADRSPAPMPDPGAGDGDGDGHTELVVDGTPMRVHLASLGPDRALLEVDAMPGDGATALTATRLILEAPEAIADGRGVTRREVVVDGWRIELEIESERRAALRDRARRGREESARGGPTEVHAIIPGRIVSVSVAAGDEVVASQQLLVVEAMKMQNELRAPRDGVVSRVAVAPGDTIEIGDLLLVLE
jgi:biotin carboxyl carrier protein